MAAPYLSNVCLLRKVTPQDVFNLPLYENHLVIDVRSEQDYCAGHIFSAVSYPSPASDASEAERRQSLVKFVRAYVELYVRPENPNPVVIYGDESSAETGVHADWLSAKLRDLKGSRQCLVAYDERDVIDDDKDYDAFDSFCEGIGERTKEIWVLVGGYDKFRAAYTFLCGDVSFEDSFPLPHQINEHVMLGSRVVPLTRDCLSKLGVTHLVVSSRQDLDWAELDGIQVLMCDVGDSNSEVMAPCWASSVEFINAARLAGGRVMVLVHGRSRSASVVVAYLIRTLHVSAEEAWELVRSNCWHSLDRSLIYFDQLKRFEKENLRSIAN